MSLIGSKFVGKIVAGFDPEGRGRYKVHVPELLQHQAESNGIFCMNNINGSRMGGSSRGMTGSYKPLYEGQVVAIEFTTEDINSARIVEVVADESDSKTPSFAKICCGTTGSVEKVKGSNARSIGTTFDTEAVKKEFEAKKQSAKQFDKLTSLVNRQKLSGTATSYAEEYKKQFGREPTKIEKELMEISGGAHTIDKELVNKKQEWEKDQPDKIQNKPKDGSRDLNNTAKEEGKATAQAVQEDRDEETIVAMTPNQSGIAIMEKSSSNPDSLLIIHKGKQTAIKMCDDGIYISTDLNSFQRICINRDIQIDCSSSITVNGGNYDIKVNGDVNIEATGDYNVKANNINLFANTDIKMSANSNANLSGKSKLSLSSEGDTHVLGKGKAALGSDGPVHIKSDSDVNIDGSSVNIMGGAAEKASAASQAKEATPSGRAVCKL